MREAEIPLTFTVDFSNVEGSQAGHVFPIPQIPACLPYPGFFLS